MIGTSNGNLNAKSPMFVDVSLPSIHAFTLHGHGTITATGINSPAITASIPGSGTIHASGATTRLDVTISGTGTALLDQLTARDAKTSLSGKGSTMLTATHSPNASASGSGSILYRGDPGNVTTAITENGTITPG